MIRISGASVALAVTLYASVPGAQPPATATLADGFADVDALFTQFAAGRHVPGAAWGIIVNGQLAHVGVSGFRDVSARAPE